MTLWWAAIGIAFAVGVLVGSFVEWGFDRAELAAYRRISRDFGEGTGK